MKKLFCLLVTVLFLLVACGGDSSDTDSASAALTATDAAAAETPTGTAAMPTPTKAPEPTQSAALITTSDEMVGIWLGTVAGESGYVMYTADGRYLVALSRDALATAPRVSGEYWFEDDQIHVRDLENAGHWAACDSETVGVYDVLDLADGQIAFQMVEDGCSEGGFTRGYVFSNMRQEWVAEPVAVTAPE
jgi:hypothetical protein